jgi:oligoendopeptidase F
MFTKLPSNPLDFMTWEWSEIGPYYEELAARPLTADTIHDWLADWTRLNELIGERRSRLHVDNTADTNDKEAETKFYAFLEEIAPPAQTADQRLKEKLLASGLEPAGMAVPLRKLRVQAELFREENLPLMTQEQKLGSEYNKITGAQTVTWKGEERTLTQMRPVLQENDRATRERAWRQMADRQLADRAPFNELWQKLLGLRRQMAANAGYDDYRAYRWQLLHRFDYTPENCAEFHAAIEKAAVPAAARIYDRKRRQLGVDSLRPWDLGVDPSGQPPLRPFADPDELESISENIFQQVDPQLGHYFRLMRQEKLLDLPNRKGKGPGAYCTNYPVSKRPFIFMNAVGVGDDVRTLLHEAGHAFHNFEAAAQPYSMQRHPGAEFAEVASFSMELLGSPFLNKEQGGFYDPADAARHRIEHLEEIICFWPYMAVVDGFQHWVYTNLDAAGDPANCDAAWSDLWQRFMVGIDWSRLEDEMVTGWHRKLHIFRHPFYYVEYGLARLGAVLVWQNGLKDWETAVQQYRHSLSLGSTVTLPELYAAAGARFAFDEETVAVAVALAERTIEELTPLA